MRLHEIDPETATLDAIPAEAKDTLRGLIVAQEHNFNIFDVNGDELLATYIPIIKIVKEHPVDLRLRRMALDRKYDKEFLDGVFIAKDEYEYYMLIHDQPLPSFWFDDDEIEYHDSERRKAHHRYEPEEVAITTQKNSETANKRKSTRHVQAAQKKHAPKRAVIEKFFIFYQAKSHPSKAQAARQFLSNLPNDERLLFSPERAEKTLTDALSKHLKEQTT